MDQVARGPHRRREAEDEAGPAEACGLGEEVLEHEEGEKRLGRLFEEVSARRVRVFKDEPPKPEEVGLRCPGPQVIIERPPEKNCEKDVEPEGEEERAELHEAEDEHERGEKARECPAEPEGEVVANEEHHQRGG